jgi:murein tripeptide amidase MpaA
MIMVKWCVYVCVCAVLRELDAIGCDMFMDVHGDETLPFNFIAGSCGIPKWGPRLKSLHDSFLDTIIEINPDMQREFGYEEDEVADLTICSHQVGERFDCLSFTLEMPFKDNSNMPEPVYEWSPKRAMHLGASFLDAIAKEMKTFRA